MNSVFKLGHYRQDFLDQGKIVAAGIRAAGSGGERDAYECDGVNCPPRAHNHKVLR